MRSIGGTKRIDNRGAPFESTAMGTTYHYVCTGCGLTEDASGGEDRGFFVRIRTMYCESCSTLVDVVTGPTRDPSHPQADWSAEERAQIGVCPRCKAGSLTGWKEGDPCPKCGKRIENRGRLMVWD